MVLLKGISISGEHVVKMSDKKVSIAKVPHYETFKEEGKADKDKVVIPLFLGDKNVLNWYPNKTCLKLLGAWYGFEMDNWLNKKFSLMTIQQKIGSNTVDVIYIDEKASHD